MKSVAMPGFEKFRVWKDRNGLGFMDFKVIIDDEISQSTVTRWQTGKIEPNIYHKKKIYEFSRSIALDGRLRLVMSEADWKVNTEVLCFTGEILRIWRRKKDISVKQLGRMFSVSDALISSIETGTMPSDRIKKEIEKVTDSYIKFDDWAEDLKEF